MFPRKSLSFLWSPFTSPSASTRFPWSAACQNHPVFMQIFSSLHSMAVLSGARLSCEAARKINTGFSSCSRPNLLAVFSALARIYYLARPNKTAMLRRPVFSACAKDQRRPLDFCFSSCPSKMFSKISKKERPLYKKYTSIQSVVLINSLKSCLVRVMQN